MDYWNGLKIAEEFFNEYGKPMLDEKFPEYKDKIAAGLAGMEKSRTFAPCFSWY